MPKFKNSEKDQITLTRDEWKGKLFRYIQKRREKRRKFITTLLIRSSFVFGIGAVAFVISLYALPGSAFVSDIYAATCLGGWENPQNAQGEPSITTDSDRYSSENSAVLENRIAEIFCGGFSREGLEDIEPTEITLRFSLLVREKSEEVLHIEGSEYEEHMEEILDAPEDVEVRFELTEPIDGSDAPPNEVEEESYDAEVEQDSEEEMLEGGEVDIIEQTEENVEPSPEPSSNTEEDGVPVSDLFQKVISLLVPEVKAETEVGEGDASEEVFETETETEVEIEEEETPEEAAETETGAGVGEEDSLEPLLETETYEVGESEDVPVITEPQSNELLEVHYATDGGAWEKLGVINADTWEFITFKLPLRVWENLENLQVRIKSTSSFDEQPTVYLDALWLEVRYGDPEKIPPEEELESEELEEAIEEELVEELVELEPLPSLSVRVFSRRITIDPSAKHSCGVEPFTIDVSGQSSLSATIALEKPKEAPNDYVVEIGGLPNGINVVFESNGDYVYLPDSSEETLLLNILNEEGSQKGGFSIPIIYTKKDIEDSSVICQMNITNL